VRCAELAENLCGTRTHLLVNAWLHADVTVEQGEDRHIYLVKFPHNTCTNEEIVDYLIKDLTVDITAETIRSYSCFCKFIEKMTDSAQNGNEFDDNEIEMQNTPYSNFFPSVTIPMIDVENIYNVYTSTTSDKLRHDAQVLFSEVLLSIIIDGTAKSIDHYFLNNDHAAAVAVDAAAALPLPTQTGALLLPTQPNQTDACGEEHVAVMEVDGIYQVDTAACGEEHVAVMEVDGIYQVAPAASLMDTQAQRQEQIQEELVAEGEHVATAITVMDVTEDKDISNELLEDIGDGAGSGGIDIGCEDIHFRI